MSGDEEAPTGRAPSNANIDQRVARVEGDVGTLRAELAGFRELVGERFTTIGDALRRIESAVTAPTATDATTAVTLADHARRLSDQETRTARIETAQTSQDAKISTVGAGVRWVGFGGVITIIGLVAAWVFSNGRLP